MYCILNICKKSEAKGIQFVSENPIVSLGGGVSLASNTVQFVFQVRNGQCCQTESGGGLRQDFHVTLNEGGWWTTKPLCLVSIVSSEGGVLELFLSLAAAVVALMAIVVTIVTAVVAVVHWQLSLLLSLLVAAAAAVVVVETRMRWLIGRKSDQNLDNRSEPWPVALQN